MNKKLTILSVAYGLLLSIFLITIISNPDTEIVVTGTHDGKICSWEVWEHRLFRKVVTERYDDCQYQIERYELKRQDRRASRTYQKI